MRRLPLVLPVASLVAVFPFALTAQTGTSPTAKPAAASRAAGQPAVSASVKDLPVRRVVLYKNGVAYFEHAGTVDGNQRVTIDFTSSQLNDVLQSLTVLDQGGGHIADVNYNSTTPIEQQLQTLALGLKDYPPTTVIQQALRGQRVEVSGTGAAFTGRLVNIEFRKESDKKGAASADHYFLIIETDSGALRTAELTDAVSIRMLDPSIEKQFAEYLKIIASAQNQQRRHLTLEARGQGQRQIEVSYISAVPVWKSTYRMVFPREANGNAILQGWAVVDNTVGADWDQVQLSLVAGAPQSFIQPLSQPIYTSRPQVPIAVAEQTRPETHEATEIYKQKSLQPQLQPHTTAAPAMPAEGGEVMGSVFAGEGGNVGGGVYVPSRTYRPSDALQPGDVSANAFDDYFEYGVTQPVTIHKNESAMVPILEQTLPAEHVTLWSDRSTTPLRAVWLENKSKLTLDAGSFSIFENGEFAGEGLLDPIHPGEKRLLSYAVDQAVKVHRAGFADTRTLDRITMHDGTLVETTEEATESTYTVTNAADEARTVIVEHTRRANAKLDSEPAPAETTASAYRFRLSVNPHQSVDLDVGERTPLSEKIHIDPNEDRTQLFVSVSKYTPELEEKLRPLIEAETTLHGLNQKIIEAQQNEKTLTDDEDRARDNITTLKGNEAARRFVDELNRAEDQIETARKDRADLEKQRDTVRANVEALIAKLSFDVDLDIKLASERN